MAARVHHTKKNTYRTASNVTRKLRTPGNYSNNLIKQIKNNRRKIDHPIQK